MKKVLFASISSLIMNLIFAQQWSGSSSTTGDISRSGNVIINNEGSGVIVDADGAQRVGFMKYSGKYGGIWRLPNAFLEIGRVNNTLQSPNGFITDIFIKENGNVGIGTNDPGSFKLAVEGKVGAREVQVTLAAWADHVFNKNYVRMSLAQLEAYIKVNNHLPNIPSEAEVKEKGIDLGDMNTKLLEKIEELTLYVIELKKENDQIKEQLQKITNKQ